MMQDGQRIVGDLNTNAEDSKQNRFVTSTSGGKPELLLIGHNDQGPGTVNQGRLSLSQ